MYTKILLSGKNPRKIAGNLINIEDVERGAELTFSGPLRGPLHHRQI